MRRPATSRRPTEPRRTRPLANTWPSGPAISTASSTSKLPFTAVRRRPASSDTPRSSSARRAPSSTTIVPLDPTAKAIQSLRAGRRLALGCTTVPAPGSPGDRRLQHAVARRLGDHRPHARPRGDLGGGQLRRHARRCPAADAGAAGQRLERVVDLDDLLDERRRRVEPRVGGEEPGRVGEEHEQVGGEQVGDERGQAVVVAEADLVVGDGVVLVDHRHHAEVEEAPERGAGVEVLLADREVERGEQHLAARPGRGRRGRSRRRASAGSGPRPRRPGG